MTARETTLGKQYRMDDAELCFVYAHSRESGGVFGLEHRRSIFDTDKPTIIETANNSKWRIAGGNLTQPVVDVDYVSSVGDGTSHGATWDYLAQSVEPLAHDLRRMDNKQIEHHLDGLQNIVAEGAVRQGEGWSAIHEGLLVASQDVIQELGWRQGNLYRGLFYLATNFAERDQAEINDFALSLER